MAGEWTDTTLGAITDFLSGGTPSKERADYWTGSIPWVSAKDMKRFRLDDTEDHVSEDGVANGTKLVPAGTVLLLARGMTFALVEPSSRFPPLPLGEGRGEGMG
jgi:type I restriction enzyme S subunit